MVKSTQISKIWRRFVDNIYTKSDLKEVLKDLTRDTANFDNISQKDWDEKGENNRFFSVEDYITKQQQAIRLIESLNQEKRQRRLISLKKWASVAALFAIILGTCLFYFTQRNNINTQIMCEISVPYGYKKTVILPDGSNVVMNAGSYIKYPERFSSASRNIEFGGEGLFKVTKNKACPFVIKTGMYHVKVLGTTFNLNNYGDNPFFTVTLRTGKVQVNFNEDQICLKPGEQLDFNKRNGQIERKDVNADNYSLWTKGQLYFNRTPIQDAVKMLQRYYNCSIRLEGKGPFTNLLSGTHDNRSLEAVLYSIEMTSGYKFKKENGVYILYK
jgi:transmembrane sensor